MKDINVQEALEHLGGSVTLYRSLVKGFIEKYSDIDSDIKHALLEGDLEEAHRLAHSMKGLAGNLGTVGMQKTAKRLDDRLKALIEKGLPKSGAMEHAYAIIVDEFDGFSVALKSAVSNLEMLLAESDEQIEEQESDESTLFEPLINALSTFNYEEVSYEVEQLEAEAFVKQQSDFWETVINYIEDYEYDKAKLMLIKGVHHEE